MPKQPILTAEEWKFVYHLLERERSDLPVEIHHSSTRETRNYLHQQLVIVDGLLKRLKPSTQETDPTSCTYNRLRNTTMQSRQE